MPKPSHYVFYDNIRRTYFVVTTDSNISVGEGIPNEERLNWLASKAWERGYKTGQEFDTNELHNEWEQYYYVCCEDCAFPPVYIIQAINADDAQDHFLNDTDICKVEEPGLADYDEESLTYNDSGVPQDIELLAIRPIELVCVLY